VIEELCCSLCGVMRGHSGTAVLCGRCFVLGSDVVMRGHSLLESAPLTRTIDSIVAGIQPGVGVTCDQAGMCVMSETSICVDMRTREER
jgi:hypothetical protein